MFRMNIHDANYIIQNVIDNKYEKLILLIDFDNMLFGIYQQELYLDFNIYINRILQTLEQVLIKINEIHSLLNTHIPTRFIHFASFGKENIRKYCDSYKENRQKSKVKAISEIVKFINKNTQIDDAVKGTRQLIITLLRNIINMSIQDQVFLLSYNIDSDLIPYIVLNSYYNPNYLFLIISADKDFVQLLTHNNIKLFRVTYQHSNNIFIEHAKSYNVITKNTIVEDIKPFKNPYLNLLYHALKGDSSDNIKGLLKYYGLQRKQLNVLADYEKTVNSFNDYKQIQLTEKLTEDLQKDITENTINCKTGIPIHSNLFQVSLELQKKFLTNTSIITDIAQQIKLINKGADYKTYANNIVREIFGLNLF